MYLLPERFFSTYIICTQGHPSCQQFLFYILQYTAKKTLYLFCIKLILHFPVMHFFSIVLFLDSLEKHTFFEQYETPLLS